MKAARATPHRTKEGSRKMAQTWPSPKPGTRGDALLKDPDKYLREARKRAREEILAERKASRRRRLKLI